MAAEETWVRMTPQSVSSGTGDLWAAQQVANSGFVPISCHHSCNWIWNLHNLKPLKVLPDSRRSNKKSDWKMNNNSVVFFFCLFVFWCVCKIVTSSIVKHHILCFSSLVLLQLALEDPVHSVPLHQFVYEKLKAQQTLMGDPGFGTLMETVDTELVRQLQEFLQGFWITSPQTCLSSVTFPSPFLQMY